MREVASVGVTGTDGEIQFPANTARAKAEKNSGGTSNRVMTIGRVEWHLWNWERWQQHSRSPGKLPKRASGGIENFSSLDWNSQTAYEESDRRAAAAVQAVLDGLDHRCRLAVYLKFGIAEPSAYLSLFRSKDEQSDCYATACAILAVELPKRAQC